MGEMDGAVMNSYFEISIIPILQMEKFKMRHYIKSLDAREGTLINICHPLQTKGAPELQAVTGVNDVLLPCSAIILNLFFAINISF